ncbi:MAG: DUF2752 domain-containing protein [Acidobacteria bacterium]|nr:DUF2752 domain-containing protein [Acidobacteriota bacterium]
MNELAGFTGQSTPDNSLSAVDRRNRCAGIGMLLSLILYASCVDPDKVTLFRCFFRELTGWNCFACGLSHSLHLSARLDWAAAVKYHLFGPVLFLSAWMLSVYWILEIALDRKGVVRVNPKIIKIGIIAIALVWLIYWLFHLSPV